jgi:glutathione S-transferase
MFVSVATLYRCPAPTDWLCPCGKVARRLRRTGEPFTEVRVPQRRARREEVRALSGQGRVPLLVIEGQVICDSRRIVEYLDHRETHDVPTGASPADPASAPQDARRAA